MDEYSIGDEYKWLLGKAVQNGGRPENGNVDGEGYTVCSLCKKDFFVKVIIRNDVIRCVEPDLYKSPYIPASASPDKSEWWENEAREHIQLGNWTVARGCFEEALAIALEPYGYKRRLYLRGVDDWETFLQSFRQSFDLTSAPVKEELGHIGRILNNIGYSCQRCRDFDYARRAYDLALVIHCELLDPTHPDAAIALYNIGRLFQLQGDLNAAWDYLVEALDVWKRYIKDQETAGYIHYCASCLYALGEIMAARGALDEARRNFEQALKLRETVLSPGHADIAENLAGLGRLCAVQGDKDAARAYLKRAMPLFVSELGEAHPVVQDLYNVLAKVEFG